jgi:hypothetical protein
MKSPLNPPQGVVLSVAEVGTWQWGIGLRFEGLKFKF